jgi:hypothetical protein
MDKVVVKPKPVPQRTRPVKPPAVQIVKAPAAMQMGLGSDEGN